MKNFVQPGNTVPVPAPYAVTSGGGLLIGSLFGVASTSAESGALVETAMVGVFDLAKVAAEAWTIGAPIYWDDTAKLATTVGSGNSLIGVATAVAVTATTAGRVRLNGIAAA